MGGASIVKVHRKREELRYWKLQLVIKQRVPSLTIITF